MEEKLLYIQTFGCQMNEHDSGKIAALLERRRYRLTDDPEKADLIVVNTCAIREKAEQKFRSSLGRYRLLKERRPGLLIGVGGCVAQAEGERLLRRLPHVDLVFGTQGLLRLPGMLDDVARRRRVVDTDFSTDLRQRFDADLIPISPSPAKAWVTVMEGCDLLCTFCVVPATRGREISRPAPQILDEVRRLAAGGVKEVTLLGQTVNAYGRRQGQIPFHELLAAIDEVPGIERIRFTSSHPIHVTAGLVEAYRRLKHLCPHLHLPVQSGSDGVLARMRRRYTRAGFLEIVGRLREARPDLALTTDIITGFPGETPEDFEATLSLLAEVRFSDLYAFAYSERPGTRAPSLPDPVPVPLRRERLARLLAFQARIGLADNAGHVGCVEDVLVEGRSRTDPARLAGRTGHNKVVNFTVRSGARPEADSGTSGPRPPSGDLAAHLQGTIVPVRILEGHPNSLLGEHQPVC
jgi:tRNA-2-methylthio-N6-dimethylallyladenosine synthase